jgi:hypothetical protein
VKKDLEAALNESKQRKKDLKKNILSLKSKTEELENLQVVCNELK